MGWLADLFSFDSSQRNRKGAAMSSTHEAFSLPTASPGFNSHPDAFNSEALNTPDPDSILSPSYTYPPQGPSPYGYIPTSSGLSSRPASASLLPTHMDPLHTPLSPGSLYPPLFKTWDRLRTWLSREYPELGDTLNYGILPQDLAQIEAQFGFALPAVVRESFFCVDGQEAESAAGCSEGLFFGLTLLPLEDVFEEWRFWREVDRDPNTGANPQLLEVMESIPPGWVRKQYSQRGWIPLIADKAGNYIGIDLNPDKGGSSGQVIVFGRDFDTKVVLWLGDGPTGWAKWLANFVDELESGEGFEIGVTDISEGSEDELGYESYFYDGSGRGQGDGGGDAGSGGGLRLTGDYRGWNVLEAWADRSMRRWHEAGVIPDSVLLPPEEDAKGKAAETVGLGVMDLTQGPGSEVPIPVLADVNEPIPPPTVGALSHSSNKSSSNSSRPPPLDLPVISVTKPPAPRPVELPTQLDIVGHPSPPDSGHSSFEEDLESGRGRGMRQVYHEDSDLVSASRKSPHTPTARSPMARSGTVDSESALIISPASQEVSTPQATSSIPDLLADPSPALSTSPIEPSTLPPQSENTSIGDLIPSAATTQSTTPKDEISVENIDPAATVRLIGGGGSAGLVENSPSEEPQDDLAKDSDAQSVTSTPSDTGPTKKVKKVHKRNKSSLAGLKKLGLGGMKKNSVGSLKEKEKELISSN